MVSFLVHIFFGHVRMSNNEKFWNQNWNIQCINVTFACVEMVANRCYRWILSKYVVMMKTVKILQERLFPPSNIFFVFLLSFPCICLQVANIWLRKSFGFLFRKLLWFVCKLPKVIFFMESLLSGAVVWDNSGSVRQKLLNWSALWSKQQPFLEYFIKFDLISTFSQAGNYNNSNISFIHIQLPT